MFSSPGLEPREAECVGLGKRCFMDVHFVVLMIHATTIY